MNKLKPIVFSALLSAGLLGSAAAVAADIEDTLEVRQSLMQLYAFNVGLVGDMAKGKSEYDAELAANAAQNLLALAKMNSDRMWPEGSSQADQGLADKTRALPEVWTDHAEFSDKHRQLTKTLEGFVEVAGRDAYGSSASAG